VRQSVRFFYNFLYYLKHDFAIGRLRGVLFISLGNLLPDLYAFGFIRPIFWKMDGARMLDCGSSVIRTAVFVEKPKNLTVGKQFQINRDSYIDAAGPVLIGDHVTISLGCKLLTLSHEGVQHEIEIIRSIEIRDHAILYANAIILPGSIIEKYVQVAAGAVLKGNTVRGGIYAGVPAKLKGFRNDIDAALYSK
jgi:acetyltransferase-like isoleucine patch superfamily enzyme